MVDIDNLEKLKMGFKQFLNDRYNHLSHKDIICSDAFYLFRQDLGVAPKEVFETTDGLERYRDKLKEHFIIKGRKNPKSDAYTYCRCARLLKEYVNDDKVRLSVPIKQNTISVPRKSKKRADIPRPSETEVIRYLNSWDMLENYRLQEEALNKLFYRTYTKNDLIEDVLVKVSTLNDFYSTNIFAAYKVENILLNYRLMNVWSMLM